MLQMPDPVLVSSRTIPGMVVMRLVHQAQACKHRALGQDQRVVWLTCVQSLQAVLWVERLLSADMYDCRHRQLQTSTKSG